MKIMLPRVYNTKPRLQSVQSAEEKHLPGIQGSPVTEAGKTTSSTNSMPEQVLTLLERGAVELARGRLTGHVCS